MYPSLDNGTNIRLLNSEAEWVALSEAVKKNMLVSKLLGRMNISVKLLVTVRVDDVGAMFMASNIRIMYIPNMLTSAISR